LESFAGQSRRLEAALAQFANESERQLTPLSHVSI
jgi:hypothetical protein